MLIPRELKVELKRYIKTRKQARALADLLVPMYYSERHAAEDWLETYIGHGRAVASNKVMDAGELRGYARATIYRAARRLPITRERKGFGRTCRSIWRYRP